MDAGLPHRRLRRAARAPQVSEFLFGDGFAISGGDDWRVRRRAVGPSLHRAYLEAMVARVFGPSAQHLAAKLEVPPPPGTLPHPGNASC